MTFGETVVSITRVSQTYSDTGTTTVYTAPSGKYAMVYLNAVNFNGSDGTSARVLVDGVDLFRVTTADGATGLDTNNRTRIILLQATRTIQVVKSNPSPDVEISLTALEFNNP